jgi:hypothetical protein
LGGLQPYRIIQSSDGHVIRPTYSILHTTALVWVGWCTVTSSELLAPCIDGGVSPPLDFMLLPVVPGEEGKAGPFPALP